MCVSVAPGLDIFIVEKAVLRVSIVFELVVARDGEGRAGPTCRQLCDSRDKAQRHAAYLASWWNFCFFKSWLVFQLRG